MRLRWGKSSDGWSCPWADTEYYVQVSLFPLRKLIVVAYGGGGGVDKGAPPVVKKAEATGTEIAELLLVSEE
jgi:hypothetical protein